MKQRLNSLEKVFNGDTAYITQLKKQQSKVAITFSLLLQHIARMSTCY